MATETGTIIFENQTANWDSLRLYFVGWCRWYQSIFSHEERPADDTIDDDEALDQWVKLKEQEVWKAKQEYKKQISLQRKGNSSSSSGPGVFSVNFDEIEEG